MRRTIFMAMVAAMLFLVPSVAQAQSNQDILRDCADDGILQGDYSASAMRNARNNMPTELDEYSDCRDVLTRAISDKTTKKNDGGDSSGGSSGGGGTGGGSSSGGGSTDSGGGTTSTPDPAPTVESGPVDSGREMPATPQEWEAIKQAQQTGEALIDDVKKVSPGADRMSADVGRNALPGSLVGVLALIAAAAFALIAAPFIRKRGLGPRQT